MENEKGQCNPFEMLKGAGLQKTAQRLAVLNILIGAERPVNVNYVLDVLSDGPQINRVTIYRTMTSLKNAGVIREIPTVDGVNYYELACEHRPAHAHFYCRSCREMVCLNIPVLSDLWPNTNESSLFTVENFHVSMTGICGKCGGETNSR